MSSSKEPIDSLRSSALIALSSRVDALPDDKKRLLCYWVRDYARLLGKESTFDSKKLLRYKRGSIVKVHLGFRLGSEEGGLHYAVVVDHNVQSSPVATVIPLTSVKPNTDLENLHSSRVYLGDEVYQLLDSKLSLVIDEFTTITEDLNTRISAFEKERVSPSESTDDKAAEEARRIAVDALRKKLFEFKQKLVCVRKTSDEISKMKHGSIALVGQITTISKISIYDPIYPGDVLSGIRLSKESMDKLDNKTIELFTRKV